MIDIEAIIREYGYTAVFLMSCIEGEFAVFTAGVLAYYGVLSLPYVILCAFTGTTISEQLLFQIGKKYGSSVIAQLSKLPIVYHKMLRILELIKKYDSWFILSCRFIWGIRLLSPLLIASTSITRLRFCFFNVVAAIVWSITIPCIGYGVGDAMSALAILYRRYQYIFYVLIVCLILGVFYIIRMIKLRQSMKNNRLTMESGKIDEST